jgi:hypothetical protein
MDAVSLARAITVRHKEPGHLRLELPARLFGPAARTHLDVGLRERIGIYRVTFEPEGRRLSIRYEPEQCSQQDVARQLRGLLDSLPAESEPVATPATPGAGLLGAASKWADRFTGGSLGSRLEPLMKGTLTEKASINFLNDVLMFYLVKVHWDLITKRWMKEPLKHADAWLTTFYLIFLLIRYRKANK